MSEYIKSVTKKEGRRREIYGFPLFFYANFFARLCLQANYFVLQYLQFHFGGANGKKEQSAETSAISFGKDISSKVQISGDKPDLAVAGEYQIVYKVDDFRYKDYQLVRRVIVEDAGGETNG